MNSDTVVEDIETADLSIDVHRDIIAVDTDRTMVFGVVDSIEIVADTDRKVVGLVVEQQTLVADGEFAGFDSYCYRNTFYIKNSIQSTSKVGTKSGYNLKFECFLFSESISV